MTAVNWKFEHLIEMVPDLMMVMFAEFVVDWLKHAFITKFNEISAEVYQGEFFSIQDVSKKLLYDFTKDKL